MRFSGPDTQDFMRLGLKGIVEQVPDLHSGRIVSTTIKFGPNCQLLCQEVNSKTKFNRGANNTTRMQVWNLFYNAF